MQNKNVILRLSRPEVLLKNINVKFLIIHIYLWHVLRVCKCPVHHVENRPSTGPHNMVNFGPLPAEIVSLLWDTPGNFSGFRVLAALLHGTLV